MTEISLSRWLSLVEEGSAASITHGKPALIEAVSATDLRPSFSAHNPQNTSLSSLSSSLDLGWDFPRQFHICESDIVVKPGMCVQVTRLKQYSYVQLGSFRYWQFCHGIWPRLGIVFSSYYESII